MRMLLASLFLAATVAMAAPQQGGQSSGSAAPPAQSGPPPAPTVTRSPGGIVVIKGASNRPAAPEQTAGDAKAAESASGSSSSSSTTAPTATAPRATSVQRQSYDGGGSATGGQTRQSTQRTATGSRSSLLLRNSNGRDVPYLTEEEQVLSEGPDGGVTERRAFRYNTDGSPASQQLVREEKRALPGGAIETTTTTYESDINGRMQAVERTVARETKTDDTTRTVATTERPAINGGFRAYQTVESVETSQGETAGTVEKVTRAADGSGRMVDVERERSVMKKSGSVATTATEIWKQSPSSTGRMELNSRTVGTLTEKPDGSSTETVETFGLQRGGGAVSVNASSPQLQERVVRETSVTASGETVQTTTTESRSVVNSSQFGNREVIRQVARPTSDGETIETQVYEQGVNGRMRQTGSSIEQITK